MCLLQRVLYAASCGARGFKACELGYSVGVRNWWRLLHVSFNANLAVHCEVWPSDKFSISFWKWNRTVLLYCTMMYCAAQAQYSANIGFVLICVYLGFPYLTRVNDLLIFRMPQSMIAHVLNCWRRGL